MSLIGVNTSFKGLPVSTEEGTAKIQKVMVSYGNSLSSASHIFTISYVRLLGEWRRDVSWDKITQQGRDWDILKCISHEEIADLVYDMQPQTQAEYKVMYKGIPLPVTITLMENGVEFP